MLEGFASDRRREPFRRAVEAYGESETGSQQQQRMVGLLAAGCASLHWAVITINAHGLAYNASVEAYALYALERSIPVADAQTPEATEARRKLLEAIAAHQKAAAAVEALAKSAQA